MEARLVFLFFFAGPLIAPQVPRYVGYEAILVAVLRTDVFVT